MKTLTIYVTSISPVESWQIYTSSQIYVSTAARNDGSPFRFSRHVASMLYKNDWLITASTWITECSVMYVNLAHYLFRSHRDFLDFDCFLLHLLRSMSYPVILSESFETVIFDAPIECDLVFVGVVWADPKNCIETHRYI